MPFFPLSSSELKLYRAAEVYEQKGNTSKVIENYEKFLDLWNNADPGLPEVEDVERRLSELC